MYSINKFYRRFSIVFTDSFRIIDPHIISIMSEAYIRSVTGADIQSPIHLDPSSQVDQVGSTDIIKHPVLVDCIYCSGTFRIRFTHAETYGSMFQCISDELSVDKTYLTYTCVR